MSLQKAIDIAGGQAALARMIGVKQGHVWKWLHKTRAGVPGEQVLPIYHATQGAVTPHELRPDIYPDPNWLPPLAALPGDREAAA